MRVSLCQRDIRSGILVEWDLQLLSWFMIDLLRYTYNYNGTPQLYLDKLVTDFACKYPRYVIASNHSSWGMGNILHYLIGVYMLPSWKEMAPYTPAQAREALYVIYKLITVYGVPVDEPDEYGRTPVQLAQQLIEDPNASNLDNKALLDILTNADTIKFRQVFLIKRFLLYKRRKQAAQIICDRVLEYVLNPNTTVGMRFLQKRAADFQMAASDV